MIRFALNVLWFICGGLVTGLGWLLAGVLLAITIVGLPYAGAAWRIAGFAFWPFGKEIVSREILTGRHDLGTGPLGVLLNVVWFVLAGWWLALGHVLVAVAEAVTIIGIPFAIKDLQLAHIALAPIGREVVRR
ncbi:YccF domain-containing protein [Caulobacter sp.]|uniref:YccF domain-containing protein n=1 Tax=Caulobacter sp. TaxID=78 RepID=UPI002B476D5E|nr:YccF domain-containing protein [Caulobacter sp.]HJV40859.1 YccF domain-containing protein [Caulobacter sp.]